MNKITNVVRPLIIVAGLLLLNATTLVAQRHNPRPKEAKKSAPKSKVIKKPRLTYHAFFRQPDGSLTFFSESELRHADFLYKGITRSTLFKWTAYAINRQLSYQGYVAVDSRHLRREGKVYQRGWVSAKEAEYLWTKHGTLSFDNLPEGYVNPLAFASRDSVDIKPRLLRPSEGIFRLDAAKIQNLGIEEEGTCFITLAFSSCGNPGWIQDELWSVEEQEPVTYEPPPPVVHKKEPRKEPRREPRHRSVAPPVVDTPDAVVANDDNDEDDKVRDKTFIEKHPLSLLYITGGLVALVKESQDPNWYKCMFQHAPPPPPSSTPPVTPPPPPPPPPVIIDNGTVWNVPTHDADLVVKGSGQRMAPHQANHQFTGLSHPEYRKIPTKVTKVLFMKKSVISMSYVPKTYIGVHVSLSFSLKGFKLTNLGWFAKSL